jgi:2-oxoglutarate ferredoxin oxidoreductase subunit delta
VSPRQPKTKVSRGTVVIDVDSCKGCVLCIDACPPSVLSMTEDRNRRGYHYPVLHPGCTGCGACAAICPDFVFQVWRYEDGGIGTEENYS